MKLLRRLYYLTVPTFRRLELRCVSYAEGDRLIAGTSQKPEHERWHLAVEEDHNHRIGFVWMERRERITS